MGDDRPEFRCAQPGLRKKAREFQTGAAPATVPRFFALFPVRRAEPATSLPGRVGVLTASAAWTYCCCWRAMSDFPEIDPSLLWIDRTKERAGEKSSADCAEKAPLPEDHHIGRRREQPVNVPFPQTLDWIGNLPQDVQPHALLSQFPRIANAIALTWNETVACKAVMNKLLVDTRGNRRGFPKMVRRELLALWAFRDPALRPPDGHEQIDEPG
jgi:hypothetical protein